MSERDPDLYGTDEIAGRLLREAELWAVVGLGNDPEKAAYRVARVLLEKGKRVVAVHPRGESVLGQPGFKTLAEAAEAVGVPDVVDCFVSSGRVGVVVDDAIAVGAGALWLQLEIVDEAAALRARQAGLDVIMDRCPAIDWPLLVG